MVKPQDHIECRERNQVEQVTDEIQAPRRPVQNTLGVDAVQAGGVAGGGDGPGDNRGNPAPVQDQESRGKDTVYQRAGSYRAPTILGCSRGTVGWNASSLNRRASIGGVRPGIVRRRALNRSARFQPMSRMMSRLHFRPRTPRLVAIGQFLNGTMGTGGSTGVLAMAIPDR